MYCAHTSSSH